MNNYKLIYEEDFKKTSELNSDIWNYEVGEKWANNESQCYVHSSDNCFIENGLLNLKATIHPNNEKCKYQSTRINTANKKHFLYGRFVFRAKMPKGRGSWPAIWFLGEGKLKDVRWPLCGEIDLVEYAGNRNKKVSVAIHTFAYNHRIGTSKGMSIDLANASDQFHDYELDWNKDRLIFKVDNKEILRIDKHKNDGMEEWPFDTPHYLIINLAVGGWYGGKIVDEDLPYLLQIESIKIYEEIEK
jgi:beta-glucanase (GH16 family)